MSVGRSDVYRLSEMIGKTVVSVESGEKLGTISDALLEPGEVRLMGLVVGHGLLGKEHVLPLEDVQTVGRDTVLARTHEHLMDPRDWKSRQVDATRTSSLRGRPVVSGGGERLGQVSDLLVDEQTGEFGGLEVERRSFGGLRHHRSLISADSMPRIGKDAIVVPERTLSTDTEAPLRQERGRYPVDRDEGFQAGAGRYEEPSPDLHDRTR
jgi:uncharacterized protein YrrD